MVAAVLSLGAGAALVGTSCIRIGPACRGEECRHPKEHTCPWRCSRNLLAPYGKFKENFNPRSSVMVWIGDPSEAPDCASINAYHARDLYQNPRSLDRCPRCVAEPARERSYMRVSTAKNGYCSDGRARGDGEDVSGFLLPAEWDGSCLSERVLADPPAEEADVVWGAFTYWDKELNCNVSLAPEDVEAAWGTVVRVCWRHWEMDEVCGTLDMQCDPPLGPGFRDCLQYYGDAAVPECPKSHPELVQAYTGLSGCTECGVEESGARETTEKLTFYADERCTQPIPATGSEVGQICYELPPGSVVRSISAKRTVERTATCTAVGGEQEGEITPGKLVSLCCGPKE